MMPANSRLALAGSPRPITPSCPTLGAGASIVKAQVFGVSARRSRIVRPDVRTREETVAPSIVITNFVVFAIEKFQIAEALAKALRATTFQKYCTPILSGPAIA